MALLHFALDSHGRIRRFSRRRVRDLLAGRAVGRRAGRELHLATAVCDARLRPTAVCLLRVPLTGGALTPADRMVLRAFARPDCVTPAEAVRHHLTGWPADTVRQLAVALDVPAARVVKTLDVGGPVFVAAVAARRG
jgi:hypothetical protein